MGYHNPIFWAKTTHQSLSGLKIIQHPQNDTCKLHFEKIFKKLQLIGQYLLTYALLGLYMNISRLIYPTVCPNMTQCWVENIVCSLKALTSSVNMVNQPC